MKDSGLDINNVSIITVTPELAKEYLKHNTHNRNILAATVNQYAIDLSKGWWLSTPQNMIIMTKSGVLANGQHTLSAIIKSGVPATMVLWRNQDESTINYLDGGKKRTVKDKFELNGISNAGLVPTMIKKARIFNGKTPVSRGDNSFMTDAEVIAEYNKDRETYQLIAHRVTEIFNKGHHKISKGNLAGLAKYLCCDRNENPDMVWAYISEVISFSDAKNANNDLVRVDLLSLDSRYKKRNEEISIFIRGWNAFKTGHPYKPKKFVKDIYSTQFE